MAETTSNPSEGSQPHEIRELYRQPNTRIGRIIDNVGQFVVGGMVGVYENHLHVRIEKMKRNRRG